MYNKLIEITSGYNKHFDKNNSKVVRIFDSSNSTYLLEINHSDNSVLVSREMLWEPIAEEFNLSDKEVQLHLNDFVRSEFKLSDSYTCNRMIF